MSPGSKSCFDLSIAQNTLPAEENLSKLKTHLSFTTAFGCG